MKTKIIFILAFLLLAWVPTAGAVTVTENTDMGWQTVINDDYRNSSYLDNIFLASQNANIGVTDQISSINPTNFSDIITSNTSTGLVFVGQLYPSGHVRYRINLTVLYNNSNSYVSIGAGGLFSIVVKGQSDTVHWVALYYYNESGVLKTDKNFTVSQPYADFYVEYFANGTTVVTNTKNLSQTMSSKYHLNWAYPYPYISSTLITINPFISPPATHGGFYIHNFEEAVPKNIITVMSDNTTFPFGFDGPRQNWTYGANWLSSRGQRATIWGDVSYLSALNATALSQVIDLVNNQGWELGVHFTHGFTTNTYAVDIAEMATDTNSIKSITGISPNSSWTSLGNADNSTHAQMMYQNYSSLWRNAPQSVAGFQGTIDAIVSNYSGSVGGNTTKFWNISSQHKSFFPAFTHSVMDSINESYSVNATDFNSIMTNYTNDGIKLTPYAEWYHQNLLSVTDITNVYLSPSLSYFNINTSGYNATTQINDPNGIGNEFWYAIGGTVTTTLSSSNITNLTINTPSNLTVQKANASVVPSVYDNVTVKVNTWNTSGDYLVSFTESSTDHSNTAQHNITNAGWANKVVGIYVDGTLYQTVNSNSNGNIKFNWTGYSTHSFSILISSPIPDSSYSRIIFISKIAGTTGNSIITSTNSSNAFFSASTLIGGQDETQAHSNWNQSNNPNMISGSRVWSSTSGILQAAMVIGIVVVILGMLFLIFRRKGASL